MIAHRHRGRLAGAAACLFVFALFTENRLAALGALIVLVAAVLHALPPERPIALLSTRTPERYPVDSVYGTWRVVDVVESTEPGVFNVYARPTIPSSRVR